MNEYEKKLSILYFYFSLFVFFNNARKKNNNISIFFVLKTIKNLIDK